MRYLKTFENFTDMGRFSDVDSDEQEWLDEINPSNELEEDEDEEYIDDEDYDVNGEEEEDDFDEFEGEEPMRRKVWGDEVIESKKNKKKPDFMDVDKDGNKKESMKKALKDKDKKDDKKDKKDDKKEEKGKEKLSAAQKKLPEGLRKAIEAKKKK